MLLPESLSRAASVQQQSHGNHQHSRQCRAWQSLVYPPALTSSMVSSTGRRSKARAPPSGSNATFLGYPIIGQQIGSDLPYTDGRGSQGTLRVYRADVNAYFQNGANGIRVGSGSFTVSLAGRAPTAYCSPRAPAWWSSIAFCLPTSRSRRSSSTTVPAIPPSATTQNVQGFYDAAGGGNANGDVTHLFVDSSGWNNTLSTSSLLAQRDHYNAPLNAGAAYGAVILSTAVNNTDNDGILDAWKAGPRQAISMRPARLLRREDRSLGRVAGRESMDRRISSFNSTTCAEPCSPTAPAIPIRRICSRRLTPWATIRLRWFSRHSPGEASHSISKSATRFQKHLHATAPASSASSPASPASSAGKTAWNSRRCGRAIFASCVSGGDCSPRFAYGQKDSYHYVLFGHSLAIPAWNSRYGTLDFDQCSRRRAAPPSSPPTAAPASTPAPAASPSPAFWERPPSTASTTRRRAPTAAP